MLTVRVRRTPSDLCCLEWVSFYGGWKFYGRRESGFCRMRTRMGPFMLVGRFRCGTFWVRLLCCLSATVLSIVCPFAWPGIVCIDRPVRGTTDGTSAKWTGVARTLDYHGYRIGLSINVKNGRQPTPRIQERLC